jgi:hypothetical protein
MSDSWAADSDEIEGFGANATCRTVDPITFKPQEGQVLPESQVLDLLPRVIVPGGYLPTFATKMTFPGAFHVDENNAPRHDGRLLFYAGNSKTLNSKKSCETSGLHLMWPPCVRNMEDLPHRMFFFGQTQDPKEGGVLHSRRPGFTLREPSVVYG